MRRRLHVRRLWRTVAVVGVAALGGLIAAGYAQLCDVLMLAHRRLFAQFGWATVILLPLGFAAGA